MELMNALFLITSDQITIWERIQRDLREKGRDRGLFSLTSNTVEQQSLLTLYLDRTIAKVKELSRKYNIPYFIINNIENHLQETIKVFSHSHRKYEKRNRN